MKLLSWTLVSWYDVFKRADRNYTQSEAQIIADWLNERATGYPQLKQFEGGAMWPNTYRGGQLVYEARNESL